MKTHVHPALPAIAVALSLGCGGGAMQRRPAMTSNQAGAAMVTAANAPAAAAATGAAADASMAAASTPKLEEKLVIEADLRLKVDDVREAAGSIRDRVEKAGGRVIMENLSGTSTSWSGTMQLRVPPAEVGGFMDWIAEIGDVIYKNVRGTDVSKQLFDQEIALENLTRTLDRLRKLLEREGLEMKDILEIEREMTRLRGEIERIKGEHRYLQDRVALATVTIQLTRKEGPVPVLGGPKAKFYPGARFSTLTLLDREGRKRTRVGGGFAMHLVAPKTARSSIEVDVFEDADGDGQSVVATIGGDAYSDFLGRGQRKFLNPYLGLRIGYGYLGGSAFVFSGGGGVELFKNRYVMVDANVKYVGFVGEDFDSAIVAGAGVVFAY